MRHTCLPEKMTVEQLGQWISDNEKHNFMHIKKTDLTEEEVTDLEHKSSLASRAIDRLNEIVKEFKEYIKNGTPMDSDDEENETHLPQEVTIPPTKGMDALKANREFADSTLERGFNEEETKLYMIPDPENQMMVCFDIEGTEWPEYTKEMNDIEREAYGKLFYKGEDGKTKELERDTVKISTKKKKDTEAFL